MGELLSGVKCVWESDRYDLPLAGHAWYNGEYGVFNIINFSVAGIDAAPRYTFSRAKTPEVAVRLMAERQLFEDMVGRHCTYGGGRRGYVKSSAIDFDGFYGINGASMHPLRVFLKEGSVDVEYVGDFEMGYD